MAARRTPVLLIDMALPGGRSIRLASVPYKHPSAPGYFRDAIMERSKLRRELFADGLAFGAASNDHGRLRVANANGWLDWIDAEAVDAWGSPVVLSILPDMRAAYGERVEVATLRLGAVLVGDVVEFQFLDDVATVLDKTVTKHRLAGNNAAPAGVEGGPDLKDAWLPVLVGPAYRFAPVCVNSVRNIYVLADRAVSAILVDAVDDNGAAITRGAPRASVAALEATAPAANTWDYFLGSPDSPAYIRFGSTPVGEIAVTARAGATVADRRPGSVIRRLLVERGGVDPDAVNAADVAALNAACPHEVGFWTADAATLRDRIDFVAGSAGAAVWQSAGVWRMRQINPPTDDPAVLFKRIGRGAPGAVDEADILSLEPVFTSRDDGGRPFDQITLQTARNHRPLSRDQLAGVALPDAERLGREWLDVVYPPDVDEPAVTHTWQTAFFDRTAASVEAPRRHAIFAVKRRRYGLRARLTPALAGRLDLAVVARVTWPRYGLAGGWPCLVTALELDLLTLLTDVTVWG